MFLLVFYMKIYLYVSIIYNLVITIVKYHSFSISVQNIIYFICSYFWNNLKESNKISYLNYVFLFYRLVLFKLFTKFPVIKKVNLQSLDGIFNCKKKSVLLFDFILSYITLNYTVFFNCNYLADRGKCPVEIFIMY